MRSTFTVDQERVGLTPQKPVVVWGKQGHMDVRAHNHEFFELVYIRSGRGVHGTASGERTIQGGDVLIVQPDQVHCFHDMQDITLFNVYYFAESFARDPRLLLEAPMLCQLFLGHHLFPESNQGAIVHQHLSDAASLLIYQELNWLDVFSREQMAPQVTRASLLKCMALIEDDFSRQGITVQSPLQNSLVRFVMMMSDSAMSDGVAAQIDEWAREYGWTADHFSRTFKSITGESPSVFHQRRRLQRAADVLIHGDMSLTQIASDLGFSDSAHFTRGFRKQYHMAPSIYRRRFQ